MAKPDFPTHPKLFHLCTTLGMLDTEVLGLCEMLWISAARSEGVYATKKQLEACAHWRGAENSFADALLAVKLLDEEADGSFSIHDYPDHCPHYVKERIRNRLKRENERFVANSCQQLPTVANVEQQLEKVAEKQVPSPPFPSLPKEKKLLSDKSDVMEGFDAFWEAYRHKVGRKAAERAWKSSAKGRPPLDSLLLSVRTYRESPLGSSAPAHPATWLNGARWQDDPGALTVPTSPRNVQEQPQPTPIVPYHRETFEQWERRQQNEAHGGR